MKDCCVPNCRILQYPLHKFSTIKEKCEEWLKAINHQHLMLLPRATLIASRYVCSAHFEKKYISRTGRLYQHALPTLHLPEMMEVVSEQSSGVDIEDEIVLAANLADNWIEEVTSQEETSSATLSTTRHPQSLKRCRGYQSLLHLVEVKKQKALTPKCRRFYRSALIARKRAARSQRKTKTFRERLDEAEKYAETGYFQRRMRFLKPTAKIFFDMQLRVARTKPRRRRFATSKQEFARLYTFK